MLGGTGEVRLPTELGLHVHVSDCATSTPEKIGNPVGISRPVLMTLVTTVFTNTSRFGREVKGSMYEEVALDLMPLP